MIDRRHHTLFFIHSCTNHKRSSADDICTLSSPPLVSTQARSQAYSSVPGVLSVACLGQRVQLELISFVFTVLEGETSVVEIPRKRGKCGFAPRDLEVRSCFARGVVRCANAWFWQTGDGGLTRLVFLHRALGWFLNLEVFFRGSAAGINKSFRIPKPRRTPVLDRHIDHDDSETSALLRDSARPRNNN